MKIENTIKLKKQLDKEPTFIETRNIIKKAEHNKLKASKLLSLLEIEIKEIKEIIKINDEIITTGEDIHRWIEKIAYMTDTSIYANRKKLSQAQEEYYKREI
ncbi:MAG: hypothetical protein Q8N08_05750 [Methanobacteriaceae archaeon]|nr:hypothetical protein [Methanobacteriaceae archaeon]